MDKRCFCGAIVFVAQPPKEGQRDYGIAGEEFCPNCDAPEYDLSGDYQGFDDCED